MPQLKDLGFKNLSFLSAKFVLPIFLWLFLMRDLVLGKSLILGDTVTFYSTVKFFFDNLRTGVYPLWNPFVVFGMPANIDMRCIGEFNPFLFLIMFFNQLGIDFYHAFMLYVLIYFWVGLIGFYLLARRLIKSELAAYFAYLTLLFSSLGMTLFSQINMLLLFVPAAWFFYFLFEFAESLKKCFFTGLIFTAMIILTTYLPFYFLTVFVLVAVLCLVVFPEEFKNFFTGLKQFCKGEKLACSVALLSIAVSLISPAMSYRASLKPDMALPTRHLDGEMMTAKGMAMRYEDLSAGINVKMSADDLFSDLDEIPFDNDGFFYVTIFSFVVCLLSMFNRLTRTGVFLFALGAILFFISLGRVTPFHRFFFDYAPYFKLFRNLYFFLPFILGIFILFTAEQLQLLLGEKWKGFKKNTAWPLVVLLGGVFLIFLFRGEGVIFTSYLTLAGAAAFFSLYFLGLLRLNSAWAIGAVAILVVLQPAQVLWAYNHRSALYSSEAIAQSVRIGFAQPLFSFLRPAYKAAKTVQSDVDRYNGHRLAMQDSEGFVTFHFGYPTRYSYAFLLQGDRDSYRKYFSHKFVAYDCADFNGSDKSLNQIRDDQNVAFASVGENTASTKYQAESLKAFNCRSKGPLYLEGNNDLFQVTHFDVNTIRFATNFPMEKFIVYNDSYHSSWKGLLDGKETDVLRANFAFKGMVIPQGRHAVQLAFSPRGGQGIYVAILIFFGIFFVYTLQEFYYSGIRFKRQRK